MRSRRERAVPSRGAARMRRVLAVAGCGVLSVGVSACESTEQESAKIAREGQQIVAAEAAHARKVAHARHQHRHHSSGSAARRAKGGSGS
jgi:hypothetical protein